MDGCIESTAQVSAYVGPISGDLELEPSPAIQSGTVFDTSRHHPTVFRET